MDDILKKQIVEIWVDHIDTNQFVLNGDGNAVNNIDDSRLEAIEVIKVIIKDFINDDINLSEFKAALDIFNRHNNLWNFSAKMGQMYFNLLLKANEENPAKLTDLLKDVISEPKDLKDALKKIEELEKFTNAIFLNAEDKRKVPYPGSVAYFLSYFWQVHNPNKWPIIYSSLINGFREIDVWKDQPTQKASYSFFYDLNEELKSILNGNNHRVISNWDIEHTFWNFKFPKNPHKVQIGDEPSTSQNAVKESPIATVNGNKTQTHMHEEVATIENEPAKPIASISFDITEYLIPKVTRLFDIKEDSQNAELFEPLVAETFKQMEFEVSLLPQGPRKNPYAALKFREENTAFLLDIKSSSNKYFSTTDDRALKESIKDNILELKKQGYNKVGFIIVCNSFDDNYDPFINYINWNTEVKKLILMTSDALLYFLAYKTKDKIKLESIVEKMANFSNIVNSEYIIENFEMGSL